MIEKITYIADDGTKFDYEDECRDYETAQNILPLFEGVQMWDANEEPIPTPIDLIEIEEALKEMRFIRGSCEKLWDAIYNVNLEYEMLDHSSFHDEISCANDTDLLMYDGDKDCWINVNRVFDECRKILRNFN